MNDRVVEQQLMVSIQEFRHANLGLVKLVEQDLRGQVLRRVESEGLIPSGQVDVEWAILHREDGKMVGRPWTPPGDGSEPDTANLVCRARCAARRAP